MSSQIRFITINSGSDGEKSYRPAGPGFRQVDPPTIYLQKLGTLWMKHRKEAASGTMYQLDRLPKGYTVWEKRRHGDPSQLDKWCYGHPSGKTFDSPNRFLPHFLNLMEHGDSGGAYCDCVLCAIPAPVKAKPQALSATQSTSIDSHLPAKPPGRPLGRPPGRPPGRASEPHSAAQAARRPGGPPGMPTKELAHRIAPVAPLTEPPAEPGTGVYKPKGRVWVEGRTDEEGTPDPYRNFIDKLKVAGSIDSLIREPQSMDWRAESISNVPGYLKKLQKKPSWIPRRMETVLFVRGLQSDRSLVFDQETKRFMVSNMTNGGLTQPLWEVGVVTQTALEDCVIDDILHESSKTNSVTTSGFRVEPLSNANRKDGKGIWKQYTYVRLHQIRPFNLWRNFLAGIPESEWHPTVINALTVMSTLTFINKYRFRGKWPDAKVYSWAMYLGSELVLQGDYVFLSPANSNQSSVEEVMRIKSITLDMWNLDKASADDYDDGHPYNSAARVTGTVFTISKQRAWDPEPVFHNELESTGLCRLGPWYLHTPPGQLSRVPFHRVMGRCYDPTAIDLWIHGKTTEGTYPPLTSLGVGLNGVIKGREYSTANYRRIEEGRTWFWADSRVEALDLHDVNGLLVASQDPDRDPKKWRKEIRVIEGTARPEEKLALQQAERRASQRMMAGNNSMFGSALKMEGIMESVETSRDRKRGRGSSREEEEDEEDEETDRNRFVDQIAIGMDDEEVPSSSDDDDDDDDGETTAQIIPMHKSVRHPVVLID